MADIAAQWLEAGAVCATDVRASGAAAFSGLCGGLFAPSTVRMGTGLYRRECIPRAPRVTGAVVPII